MQLKVKDIEKLWKGGAASLVAGKGGLERLVDVYDIMEQPDVKPWMREHLLMITTGYAIRNDKQALLNLLRIMNDANASALAIKTRFFDEFPKEALELADELNLPLFFLNNNYASTELIFPIMTAIVEAKNNVEMNTRFQLGMHNKQELDNRLFMELQTGKITQAEEVDYRINSLQWPASPIRMIILQMEDQADCPVLFEMKRNEQRTMVSNIFNKYHIKCIPVCRKSQCICIMKDYISKDQLEKITEELLSKTEELQKCQAFAMITERLINYLELPNLWTEIEEIIYIRKLQNTKKKMFYIREFRYELIMYHVAQLEETREFVSDKLGKLGLYDREHDTNLVETMEMLISKNGSVKQTAEALFLHRNTMTYRIKKIEEVLECDLDDMEQLMEFRFACKVRKYMS